MMEMCCRSFRSAYLTIPGGRMEGAERQFLNMFIRDAARIPLMTREEEVREARQARSGDVAARNRLASANLRFVLTLAFRYRGSGAALMELVSAGCLGVLIAADRFDPDVGVRFTTYAGHWIREAMQGVIARESDFSTVSLDDPPGEEGGALTDLIADEGRSFERALKDSDARRLLDHPGLLTERERRCLRLRYYGEKTLREAGESLGLTKTRISEIEARALHKLRRHLASFGTDEEKALLRRRGFIPLAGRA